MCALGQLPNQFGPDNGAVALGLMKHVAIASSRGPGVRTSEKHAEKIRSPEVLGHSEQVGPGKNKLINETARDTHVPNNSPQLSGNRAASASLTSDATQGQACADSRQKGAAQHIKQLVLSSSSLAHISEQTSEGIGNVKANPRDSQGSWVDIGADKVFAKRQREANHLNQPAPVSSFPDRVSGHASERTGNVQASTRGPQGSWADRVRVSSAKSRFCLDGAFEQVHGRTEYTLPDELIEDNFDTWTRCLIGFILGSSFPFHAARTIAFKEWKPYGIEAFKLLFGSTLHRRRKD